MKNGPGAPCTFHLQHCLSATTLRCFQTQHRLISIAVHFHSLPLFSIPFSPFFSHFSLRLFSSLPPFFFFLFPFLSPSITFYHLSFSFFFIHSPFFPPFSCFLPTFLPFFNGSSSKRFFTLIPSSVMTQPNFKMIPWKRDTPSE